MFHVNLQGCITYPNTCCFFFSTLPQVARFFQADQYGESAPNQQLRWISNHTNHLTLVEVMPARSLTPQLKTFQAVEDLTDCSKRLEDPRPLCWRYTLPETKVFAFEQIPGPKRKGSFPNNQVSGASCKFQGDINASNFEMFEHGSLNSWVYNWRTNIQGLQPSYDQAWLSCKYLQKGKMMKMWSDICSAKKEIKRHIFTTWLKC